MTRSIEQVDRGSRLVLWRQAAERAAQAIGDRKWTVGDRMPSEVELCLRFGVSRVMLRQAVSELQRRGLAHARARSGWYVGAAASSVDVVTPLIEPRGLLPSFTQIAQGRGLPTGSVVLRCEVWKANWDEATKLSIAPGARFLSLLRVRRLDGLHIAYDHSLFPAGLIGEVTSEQFATGSLFDALRATEHALACGLLTRSRRRRPGAGALLLGCPAAGPSKWDITCRGDRYQFRAVLHV